MSLGLHADLAPAQEPPSTIWVAIRGDGEVGSGAQSDPFDGSTADRFVPLIQNAPPNTIIHIGPGTYPAHLMNVAAGIQLLGAGKNTTILSWDGTGNTDYDIVNVIGDNVMVSNLTIDCRADIYPVTPNALQSWDASGVTFERVRATNIRADAANPHQERFPIAQFAQSATRTNGLIDNCEVDHFTGCGTMINFLHGGSGAVSVYMSGTISNNYIHDCPAAGIGLSGAGDTTVTGNTVDGAFLAIIHDTSFSPNVRIINNMLIHLHQYGIVWHSDNNGVEVAANGSVNTTISNNQISLTAERNDSVGLWVSGKNVTATKVSGNIVTTEATPSSYMVSFLLGYGDNTQMLENKATDGLNPKYYQAGTDPLTVSNNRFLSNAPMPVPANAVVIAPGNKLLNVSTRAMVGQKDGVMIGGFIITGNTPKKIVLRAIGPSLVRAGVKGALLDPTLELHSADGTLIASNDNWKTHLALVTATGVGPDDDRESAIVATLSPGSYTAVVRGARNTSGAALVELYDLNPSDSQIANISTRAQVDGTEHPLIGGFIVGGDSNAKLLVRALGPSLAAGGVANALANPILTLYDSDGSMLYQNDDWGRREKQQIIDSGLAPTNDREAGIIAMFPAGNYTAVVTGASGGSGIALVEIYSLGE